MAKYFTIEELVRSGTAVHMGIDNVPPPGVMTNLMALMDNCLDPVRQMWGRPITVNSGFRCPALNKAVGGSASSQHMKGEAADITAGSRAENKKLFGMIAAGSVEFDQVIDESNYSWIHISYRAGNNRRNVLHL